MELSVVQLDLFKTVEECEMDAMRQEMIRLRISSDKVRKGMYARLNQLEKMYIEIQTEFDSWKRTVCKEKN